MKDFGGVTIVAMFLVFALLFGCSGEKEDAIREAVEKKDPSICNRLEEKSDKEGCFEGYAQELHDPAKCNASINVNGCITAYALRARSAGPCDLILDVAGKYACVVQVTGDKTGRSIDTILGEFRNKNVIESCVKGCKATAYDSCITPCENTREEGHRNCVDTDPDNLGNCFYPVDTAANKCIEDCRWEQWDCEDRCKEAAEGEK